jgi:hypothetical protein
MLPLRLKSPHPQRPNKLPDHTAPLTGRGARQVGVPRGIPAFSRPAARLRGAGAPGHPTPLRNEVVPC